MNSTTCLALSPTGLGGVEKVLAIAGGAALGALLLGFLTQLLCRALTTRKVPRGLLFLIRLLGAVVCGWLVALWVFGGGGGGLGGPGGSGRGAGAGKGTQQAANDTEKNKEGRKPEEASGALRVEVLGKAALERVAAGKPVAARRCYRVEGKEKLLTLPEVEDLVKQRREQTPPLRRLDVILYNDSPARDVPYVRELVKWAEDLSVSVDITERDEDAPTR